MGWYGWRCNKCGNINPYDNSYCASCHGKWENEKRILVDEEVDEVVDGVVGDSVVWRASSEKKERSGDSPGMELAKVVLVKVIENIPSIIRAISDVLNKKKQN